MARTPQRLAVSARCGSGDASTPRRKPAGGIGSQAQARRSTRQRWDCKREPFWLCPLCNFLTRRPGICEQCKRKETYPV